MTTLMLWLVLAAGGGPALTLEAAVEAALATHPDLAAAQAAAEVVRAQARQDGAWDNPSLFFRLEAAPRDGDAWNGGERILGISQAIPLAGTRGAIAAAGLADARAASLQADVEARRLEALVRHTYATAWHARQTASLRREALTAAASLLDVVSRRTEAGDAAGSDLRRARMIHAATHVELDAADADLAGALAELGALVGRDDGPSMVLEAPTAAEAGGPVEQLSSRAQAARAQAKAAEFGVTAARRQRWPGLELEAGLRSAPDGDGFDLGLSLDLPLLDRGRARVQAARAQQAVAEHQAAAVDRQLAMAAASALARRQTAERALTTYDDSVVPDAEAALTSVRTAFDAGDVDLTEVLQVTREWIAARQARLDWELARAAADAELVGLR